MTLMSVFSRRGELHHESGAICIRRLVRQTVSKSDHRSLHVSIHFFRRVAGSNAARQQPTSSCVVQLEIQLESPADPQCLTANHQIRPYSPARFDLAFAFALSCVLSSSLKKDQHVLARHNVESRIFMERSCTD